MRINLGEKIFNLKSNLTYNKYNCLLFFVSEAQTCLLQSIPFGREQVTVFAGYVKKKCCTQNIYYENQAEKM